MSFDDRMRDAFERSAPDAPNPSRAREELRPAMGVARRRYRIRRGIATSAVGLAIVGGGVAGALQLTGGPDDRIDTIASSLPAPETTAVPSSTIEPLVTSTRAPADDPTTTPTASPTTSNPNPTSTTEAPPSSVGPGGPLPTTTNGTTTTSEVPSTLDGPHTTPCGSVTFRVTSVVFVDSHTTTAGYEFITKDDGTTEVEAKWHEGPGDECQIEAHLEAGVLDIHFDEE